MEDEQTYEVGSTIAPLAIGPYNDVWFQIFGKYNIFEKQFFVSCKNNSMAPA
jgi:hypothetical protein